MLTDFMVKAASRYFDVPIASFMSSPEVVLQETDTFQDALKSFLRSDIKVVFVIDEPVERHLKGILTRADVEASANTYDPAAKLVDIARKQIVVLRSNNTVGDAVKVFAGQNPVSRPVTVIPIVDDSKRLVGYLDNERLFKEILPSPA
jgi:predicted transcriptional regulator